MAHCFGAREIVPDLERTLEKRLLYLGYSETEMRNIISQIFVAGFVGGYKQLYTSSFLVKSISDKYYSDEYKGELLNLRLGEIKMTESDKGKVARLYANILKDRSNLNLHCANLFKRYKYLLSQVGNEVTLYTAELTKTNSDHEIHTLHRDSSWRVDYSTNRKGDIISQTFAYALASGVVNSISNCESEPFIPLDMEEMKNECESLLEDLRLTKTERDAKKQGNGFSKN